MRLLFVNRFYWPETPATGQLLTDLAEALAARGGEVSVITSAAHAATLRRETHHGVQIFRVRGTRWHRGGVIGKAFDFGTFYLGALWRTWRMARRGMVIVPMTDPPLLGIGVWLAARSRGARVIHWVQDIYPELAMELGGQSWLRCVRPLRNLAWRRADRCVALGEDMASVSTHGGVAPEKLSVIPNWRLGGVTARREVDAEPLRREWQVANKFIVAYSGNLGRVHDLEPVLAVADALRDDPRVAFVFIGDGAQRAALEAAAVRRSLPNVSFQPPQPRSRLAESLAAADVHLVTLRAGCERLVFPSKLYGVAAVGRPILFIGPVGCEVARIVSGHGLGLAAERSEIGRIAEFIRSLASDRAACARHGNASLRFAEEHTLERAVTQWCSLLADVDACALDTGRANTRAR